jgi:hypothetical protein
VQEGVNVGINHILLDGELLNVHCARKDTDSVGVTYKIWRESLRTWTI